MKPFVVIFADVILDDFLGFLKFTQGSSPDAFRFEVLIESFDLSVGLQCISFFKFSIQVIKIKIFWILSELNKFLYVVQVY